MAPWFSRRREASGGVEDRRKSVRYPSGAEAELGWWEGEAFRTSRAVLIDVSQGGAAALMDGVPPPPGPAYLRLASGAGTDWCEVEVRGSSEAPRGRSVAHVGFVGGPSYSMFRAAMPGTALDGKGKRFDADEIDTRYWK